MKIRVFQSDKGDCLLLTSKDGKHVLADGGVSGSYSRHVAPFLGKLRQQGEILDLVYVSHIDQDHIAGVLRLMDDELDWKIHDFQVSHGNSSHQPPRSPRPPEVKSIWHNSFHDQLEENAGPIEELLAASASALSLRSEAWIADVVEKYEELATSKREAVLLSRRIGTKQLNIPLNQEYGGGLMYVAPPPDSIKLGAMRLTVIGPFADELDKLRVEWNQWLKTIQGKKQIAKIKKRAQQDEHLIGNAEIDDLLAPLFAFSEELGDRDRVTVPNLASLMLLIEEEGHRILMTGDGHCDDVWDGLDVAGKLSPDGCLHVDILKMPHHGSEHNWNEEFGRRITANDYVFCGDGSHHNPDQRVVEGIINSRLGSASVRSSNPEVDQPFKIWFNSSERVTKTNNRSHMKKLEQTVHKAVSKNRGQLQAFFLKSGSSFELQV